MGVENGKGECATEWEFKDPISPFVPFTTMKLSLTVTCSLSGVENFVVRFHESTAIQDLSGNPLGFAYLTAGTRRHPYLSAAEDDFVQASAATLSWANLITYLIVMAIVTMQYVRKCIVGRLRLAISGSL